MPDEHGRETEEEAAARVAVVRQTQIFGDTPTDPTIGDVVVPAHDEEASNVAAAEVASRVEDGDEEAADLSPEEAKRQLEPLSADDVQEGAEEEGGADAGDSVAAGDTERTTEEGESDSEPSREELISQIEAADSVEEVDRLAADDERVTVQRAAEKRRGELS
jgi:hypothetical protein